jgi:serine/threonine-protein kinase RsbW
MSAVLDDVVEQLQAAGFPHHDRFAVRLALEEAIVNAVKHGHREDTRKTVLLRFCVEETFFIAQVEDEGPGFQPEAVPDPREAEEQSLSGRGLLLMRHFMNAVEFNAAGNCVTLCKHRSAASDKEE